MFQQDSAPVHKARQTQLWCKATLRNFVSTQDWPPSSPHLIPLNYSSMESVGKPHKNITSLEAALTREWNGLDADYMRRVEDAFPHRLRECIKPKKTYLKE